MSLFAQNLKKRLTFPTIKTLFDFFLLIVLVIAGLFTILFVVISKRGDIGLGETTSGQKPIWNSLTERVETSSNSKIDIGKTNQAISSFLGEPQEIFHTAQTKLEYSGEVQDIIFNENSLTLRIKINKTGNIYEREFIKEEMQRLEVYLYNQGRPLPLPINEIKTGDTVNVIEINNLLAETDQKDLLIIQVERKGN